VARATFTEQGPEIPSGMRTTRRVRRAVACAVVRTGRSRQGIACPEGVVRASCAMLPAVTDGGTRFASRLVRAPLAPRLVGSLLVVGYLLHVALRLAISYGRDGPTNFADETGYLVNARIMSGGGAGELGGASFYRGGYSLLLVPAQLLGGGPLSEYRYALATNALVSSLVFPLVYGLLARVFRVPIGRAFAAAFLAALYPPLVVTTQFASAESLLPVLVLLAAVTLAAVVTTTGRAETGWAIACGGCAGALYTTHGRTAPLVAVLLALLLGLALLRHDLAVSAAAGIVAMAAVTVAGVGLNGWLRARSWGDPQGGDDVQRVLASVRDLGSLKNIAALGMGQYWYVFVATFGLVVLGLVEIAGRLSPAAPLPRRVGLAWVASREAAGAPVVAVFLLGSAIGLAVLVGLFLRPPTRPDHVVYGRYVEILVPPFLALGLVRLWTTRIRRLVRELAVGAAAALFAVVAVTVYAGGLVRGPVNWYTVLALPPLAQTRDLIRPVNATLVAVAGAVVVLVVTRRYRMWAAAGLAGVLVASSIALRVVLVEARDQAIYGTQPVALSQVEGLNAAQEVSYDLAAYTAIGLYSYQWQLDRTHFVLFDSRRDPAPHTKWVIAGLDWPQARQVGAERVWVHPAYGQAVWRAPWRHG
jgi:hypothetical protein